MWQFNQKTGWFSDAAGKRLAQGYAGSGKGKNNPEMQSVHDAGPLPRGIYTAAAPVNTTTHGPYVLWLTPDPANEMFGRSGFGVHGDSIKRPGEASLGCIVLPRFAREAFWKSGNHRIEVV